MNIHMKRCSPDHEFPCEFLVAWIHMKFFTWIHLNKMQVKLAWKNYLNSCEKKFIYVIIFKEIHTNVYWFNIFYHGIKFYHRKLITLSRFLHEFLKFFVKTFYFACVPADRAIRCSTGAGKFYLALMSRSSAWSRSWCARQSSQLH